jgi:tripartite-type tricarboxylate transporter receptor subunit TctC
MNFCIPVSWYAIFAPVGTLRDVVARFIAEAKRALQIPEVKDKLATLAIEAGGTTAEELTVTLNDEMERIRLLVKPGAQRPE